ncbi:MAG: phospho-sugar mutase [Oscillospiraceae bacterium]
MYLDEYKRWKELALEDKDIQQELAQIEGNDDGIKDRFAIDLSFGTAGLRGVIGAGTNRMNIYTVRRATQGFAEYLCSLSSTPSVAIAYDSRVKSDLFAREAACVMAANRVTVHLYPVLEPVPALSFAVRHLHADAGIMITASHNPAKYNGYKAYGPDGCQMTDEAADAVLARIQNLDIFNSIQTMPYEDALAAKRICLIGQETLETFYQNVKAQSIRPGICKNSNLKLVYSPLNGTGNVPVRRILADIGLTDITIVPEQELPDGNFPTCPYPNPEIKEALALGLSLAQKIGADLMLATDPDADRVGIAVRDEKGEYHLLSGNEVGVLLLDYIAKGRKESGTMPANPVFVKSIVTTPMADAVAEKLGIETINVLTGFKYIGEQILHLEQKGEADRFVFGFEESYGYLSGTYVRDKDAVVASMLICEMAAYHRTQGSSLYEALNKLYEEYGRYYCKVDSFTFEGLSGMEKMAEKMKFLRENPSKSIAGLSVTQLFDYQSGVVTQIATEKVEKLNLPSSNVLRYVLQERASVVVRPSGTEPKLKIYYTSTGINLEKATAMQQKMAEDLVPIIQ